MWEHSVENWRKFLKRYVFIMGANCSPWSWLPAPVWAFQPVRLREQFCSCWRLNGEIQHSLILFSLTLLCLKSLHYKKLTKCPFQVCLREFVVLKKNDTRKALAEWVVGNPPAFYPPLLSSDHHPRHPTTHPKPIRISTPLLICLFIQLETLMRQIKA